MLNRYVTIVDGLSGLTGRVSGWAFFAIGLFVTFEVFMRYVLTMPTIWVDEVSRILQVWAAYLAIAYVLRHRNHIVIDIAFRKPGTLPRRVVDTFAMLVIIFFCTVTVYFGWQVWLKSTLAGHTTDTYLAVPKVFIQSSIWIGFGLLMLQSLAEIIKIWTGQETAAPASLTVH